MTAWDKSSLNGGAPRKVTGSRRTVGGTLPVGAPPGQRRRGETKAEPRQGRRAAADRGEQCTFVYAGSGVRCVFVGRLVDGRCAAHREELLRERKERKLREDKRRVGPPALPRHLDNVHDHTAPWRCGLRDCPTCTEKPTFGEWSEAMEERRTSPSG